MARATTGQSALWTFLSATLIGPFFAALIVFAASLVAVLVGRGPPSLLALPTFNEQLRWAAEHALTGYVWGAMPAAFAGAAAAALILWRGRIRWLEAAVLAGVTATAVAVLSGGQLANHVTPIAFIAATAAVLVWAALRAIEIIAD